MKPFSIVLQPGQVQRRAKAFVGELWHAIALEMQGGFDTDHLKVVAQLEPAAPLGFEVVVMAFAGTASHRTLRFAPRSEREVGVIAKEVKQTLTGDDPRKRIDVPPALAVAALRDIAAKSSKPTAFFTGTTAEKVRKSVKTEIERVVLGGRGRKE